MGLRFRKQIKIFPGLKLNIGSKSIGVSAGGKYGGVSINSRTGVHSRISAPGTGLSYTKQAASVSASKTHKKPNRKFPRWLIVAAVVVLLLASCGANGNEADTTVAPSETEAAAPVSTPVPTVAPEPTVAPTPVPTVEPTPEPTMVPADEPVSAQYIASAESDKYHTPGCRWAENIAPENLIEFASAEDAKAAGYSRCGTCKP